MTTSMLEQKNDVISAQRFIDTPGGDIKENFLYVQETGLLKNKKPGVSHREKMDSYLIIYVLSGEGFFTYRNKQVKVYPGACFYINCQQPYTHEALESNPWELIWVHFNGKPANQFYEYFTQRCENIFYPENPINTMDTLREIFQNTQAKPLYYELRNHLLITTLLTELITCQKQRKKSFQHITTDQKLGEIQSYLEKNYMQPCSLEKLSKQFYMSKYYLSREFKQRYGEGISSYLTKLRITRAKELLRFSDMSISEIASSCGVNDSNHFLKTFKKVEGVTPTEYRKKWRE